MTTMKEEEIEKEILEFIKSQRLPINKRQISRELNMSYTTILKYCAVLKSKGKIEIINMGKVPVLLYKK